MYGFPKDKTPYRVHLAFSIGPGGRQLTEPGYYVHFEPGKNFIAGGIYRPEPEKLSAIRQEMDYNEKEFLGIINQTDFKKNYGDLDPFDSLKTAPKGYPKDHPMIKYLRMRSLIAVHKLSDKQVLSPDFMKNTVKALSALNPFHQFILRALD